MSQDRRSCATSAPRWRDDPHGRGHRGDQRRRRSPPRARTTSRTTCRSSTRSCWCSASIALLVGSFIIFNTFSIIVAQRGRELALLRAIGAGQRQVIGSVLFEAVLVGLTASTIGFVGGILLAAGAQGVARRARASTSPRAIDRDPRHRRHLVVRHRHGRHRRRRGGTGVARRRASRRSRRCATPTIDTLEHVARVAAVIGGAVTLVGVALLAARALRRQRAHPASGSAWASCSSASRSSGR